MSDDATEYLAGQHIAISQEVEAVICRDKLMADLTEWFNRISDADDGTGLTWREYQVMVDIVNEAFFYILPAKP